jgi:N-acetylglutamate synthase-like GNAT family acetyltransferase
VNTSIRFGKIDDLDLITTLDKSIRKNQLDWKLQNDEIILAEMEKELVGYLRVEYLWAEYPYIGLIIVRPEHQRKGIGRKLLAYLEEHLERQGIYELYSSSQVNEPEPQEWHRHMGFRECGMINGINDGSIGEVFFRKMLV